jgi:hypothetical protein
VVCLSINYFRKNKSCYTAVLWSSNTVELQELIYDVLAKVSSLGQFFRKH